jgi:putative transposase
MESGGFGSPLSLERSPTPDAMKLCTIPSHILASLTPLRLPQEAYKYINDSEVPSTRPNGVKSYTVKITDDRSGEGLELASRDVELAFYLSLRCDPAFAFVRSQPPHLNLELPNLRGRNYAPDFLVFWNDGRAPTLFETKPSTGFADYCTKFPKRYTHDDARGYEMPLAEAAAKKLGFTFRGIHEGHFSPTFLRNALLLFPYRQHPKLSPEASDAEKEAIKAQVAASPGIKITELENCSMQRRADLVHLMLTQGEIFTHLSLEVLTEPNRVSLYPTAIQEKALELFYSKNPPRKSVALPYILTKGVKFEMGRRCYTILEAGAQIQFRDDRGRVSSRSCAGFLDLVPKISAIVGAELTREERIGRLTDDVYQGMMRRYARIRPYLPDAPPEIRSASAPTERKAQRYLEAYREAEKVATGYGICGLIPRISERGSKSPLLPEGMHIAMRHIIVKHYLQANPRLTIQDAYYKLTKLLLRTGTDVPSYNTFVKECRKWDESVITLKRWGSRIAQLGYVPNAIPSPFGSPHGERPYTIAHVDHTTSDIALAHPDRSKRLNKPVHSIMVDATTDRSLAWVTRFDSPSTETLVQLFRHCVERNGCLPNAIMVDWGPDFQSEWLHKTMADLGVTIYYRMKSNGPAGTIVEDKFKAMDGRLIHRAEGSTQIMKRARLVTKAMQPAQFALWTLKDFAEGCDRYHTRFNNTPYGKNKLSPDEREEELCRIFGTHPRGVIPKEVYFRALLPAVKNVTRIVGKRCRFEVDGVIYASSALKPVIGESVEVRKESTKMMYASHPRLPHLIPCPAVGHTIKHTASETEAHAIAKERALLAPDVEARKNQSWADASEEREATEAKLRRQRKAQKRVAKAPAPPEVPDNIVEFDLPVGGLVDLRSMEGEK